MNLTHQDVIEILALLDTSGFDELRLETERYKLYVRRPGAPASAENRPAVTAPAAAAPSAAAAPAATAAVPAATPAPAASPAAPAAARTGLVDVVSPMVGIFYRAPKPGDPPFVESGSAVDEASVIGIIEVMKLMNSISAGTRGTVVEVVAADGELVQYGSVLARIAPAGVPPSPT